MRGLLSLCALCALLLAGAPALAWQDITGECALENVRKIADPKTTPAERQAATWFLVSVHRAAVYPLAEVARKYPALAWEAVHLLDLIRTDRHVVEVFSEFLDSPPEGLRSTGEVQGFLGSRLEDMLGRRFRDSAERRAWVKENGPYLAYEPATFRFSIDQEARAKGQLMLHYPFAASPHAAVDLAYNQLVLALHLDQREALARLLGPEVKLARGGGRRDTVPELDLDRFKDPPANHRAVSFRDEGHGRWLVRANDAYYFFEGERPICVEAGMKPIE
ncbi:MAG TPA: hypothetical protein PK668_26495 [Myxococcota bacterium]|nr:hypothetical protein [Myxococcota bacterium]HRY97078.1 hypothetical protein [Myxococcota bacterium]HSA21117.1 hypothetical protein [Myxococcota bacterium]